MLTFIGALNRGGLLQHTLTRDKDTRKLTPNGMIVTDSSYAAADGDAGGSSKLWRYQTCHKKGQQAEESPQ
jgi:hypothetical protein